MTNEIEKQPEDGFSRRGVLRRGAFVATAATVGLGTFAAPAAASMCPRTPGYWMNHDWPTNGLSRVNLKVGTDFSSVEDGQDFLRSPAKGDKGHIMATHLIATVLNFQETGECYDVDTVVTDSTSFRDIKRAAEDWLESSNFPEGQRSWIVDDVDGEPLKNFLDEFNNGVLLDCNCPTDD